jgi:hypothetical protein
MQLHIRTLFDYGAITVYLLALFALIGAPVKLALRLGGVSVGRMVPAPVIGLALIVGVSWYWATPFGGTKPVARLLLVVAAVALALIVVACRKSRPLRSLFVDAEVRALAGMGALCFAGLALVMVINDTQLFTNNHFTVLTLGNNDAPSYALMGQQLLDEPREAGNIVGYNAGARSLGFSGGAYAALAGAASLTGLDVWRVMNPMLLVVCALGAYSLALLVRRSLSRRHATLAAGAAVVGFSVFYVAYLVAQWFFAQLLGMAFVFAVIGVVYDTVRSRSHRDSAGGVVLASLLLAAGLSIYPHMTMAGSAVLLPIVALASSPAATLRRAVHTGIVFGAACLVAGAAVPGVVRDAIDITRDLKNEEAGWSLPSIFPSEMLGFQSVSTGPQGWLTVAVSVAIVLGLFGAAVFVWRRTRNEAVLAFVGAIVLALATYVAVYQQEGGPTYRQWKWVTFFIPIFVASAIVLVGLTVVSLRGRAALLQRAGPGAFAVYVAIVLLFSSGAGFPLSPPAAYFKLTADQINLQYDDRLAELPSLHVNTGPYWETMWIVYFLRDVPVTLQPDSYYPKTPAQGPWYLERNDQPLAPGAEATPLNGTYRLVKMPG